MTTNRPLSFLTIPPSIWNDDDLFEGETAGNRILLLGHLLIRCNRRQGNPKSEYRASLAQISYEVHLTEQQVRDGLEDFIRRGWFTKTDPRRGRATTYRLTKTGLEKFRVETEPADRGSFSGPKGFGLEIDRVRPQDHKVRPGDLASSASGPPLKEGEQHKQLERKAEGSHERLADRNGAAASNEISYFTTPQVESIAVRAERELAVTEERERALDNSERIPDFQIWAEIGNRPSANVLVEIGDRRWLTPQQRRTYATCFAQKGGRPGKPKPKDDLAYKDPQDPVSHYLPDEDQIRNHRWSIARGGWVFENGERVGTYEEILGTDTRYWPAYWKQEDWWFDLEKPLKLR